MSKRQEKKWEGFFYRLSFSEKYDKELFAELSSMPARLRSTRLKALALVGLYALSNKEALGLGVGGLPSTLSVGSSELDDKVELGRDESKADTIKDRLKGIAGKSLLNQ